MQRLALFDLDNTLIDLDAAFLLWAHEFAKEHRLSRKAVDHLVKLDRNGLNRAGCREDRVSWRRRG
ncbi:hypothetical protein GCM10018953_18140 [Streptosporangium nondiastaticum]|uniref:hypothetical protein n=1 Tax=Streptosporangium nondiastaticum TaxID=35764 RepID=UPI0031F7488B